MTQDHQRLDPSISDKTTWLADQVFKSFPDDVTGLVFDILDCGCIYYRRKHPDGRLDLKFGIYRNGEDGPCEKCMLMDESWKARVIDEEVIYNTKFHIL